MEYEYGFEYAFPEMMEGAAEGALVGAAGIATGILLIIWFLAMGFSVVSYVLNAVGMYRIAKRRGIHHAWLAWVPIGCNWLLGSISDHYQYVAKQKVTSRRKILLILSLILVAVTLVYAGAIVALVLTAEGASGQTAGMILPVALLAISYLAMMGLAIAIAVFCYIAYYDLFRSSKPKYDVLFLVLGILFNVTLAFFVFACSSADEGMPARRTQQPPAYMPPQPEEPAAPAWEEEIPAVEAEVVEDFEE